MADEASTRSPDRIVAPHPQRTTLLGAREENVVLDAARTAGTRCQWIVPLWRRIQGTVDVDALQASLDALALRHEPLRAAYELDGGAVRRAIRPGIHIPIERSRAANRRPELRPQQANDLLLDDVVRPFDLSAPPLLRARLVELSPSDRVLGLAVHHLLADRVSTSLLNRDLWELYGAHVERRDADLPDLPVGYFDYVAWRREDAGGRFAAHRRAWSARLSGVVPMPRFAPARGGVARSAEDEGEVRTPRLRGDVTAALQQLCRSQRVSMFMVHLAAYAAVLSRYAGTTQVVVDGQSANRMRRELRHMVGCLYNLVRFAIDLEGVSSFLDVLQRVREVSQEAMAHQEMECDTFLLDPLNLAATSPRASVRFVFRSGADNAALNGEVAAAGLRIAPFRDLAFASNGDLGLLVDESPEGDLALTLSWKRTVFDDGVMRQLARDHVALLEAVAADASVSPAGLGSAMQPAAAARAVAAPDRAVRPVASNGLDEALARALAAHAERVAIDDGAQSHTYAALAKAAESVRRALSATAAEHAPVVAACPAPLGSLATIVAALQSRRPVCVLDPRTPHEVLSPLLEQLGAGAVVRGVDAVEPVAGGRDGTAAYVVAARRGARGWSAAAVAGTTLSSLLRGDAVRDLRTADTVLLAMRPGCESFVVVAVAALLKGARLVVAPPDATGSAQRIAPLLRTGVTGAYTGADVLDALLAMHHHGLGELRRLVGCGWSTPTPASLERRTRPGSAEVVAVHAPASAPALTCAVGVERIFPRPSPIAFTAARHHIVDGSLRPLPRGAVGDLVLRGELPVAEVVVATPPRLLSAPSGEPVYRTGLRARAGDDGALDVVPPMEMVADILSARPASTRPDVREGGSRSLIDVVLDR